MCNELEPGHLHCASKHKYLIRPLKEIFVYELCVTLYVNLLNKIRKFPRVDVG